MPDGDLVFIVELAVKPESAVEWKAALLSVIDRMSEEDAFVGCDLLQDPDDPDQYTLYERWNEPSVDVFVANQMTRSYRREYEARLPEWLRSPRAATVRRHVREWRGRERAESAG